LDAGDATYAAFLKHLRFGPFPVPLISCVTGQVMRELPPAYWWRVVREPIRFPEAIATIECTCPSAVYLDLGPSGSLAAALVRMLDHGARTRVHTLMSPFQRNAHNFAAVLDRYAGIR
jgi:acyl transferase domain-containing protein